MLEYKGKIKRDLTRPAGEVSLKDTTIQDELILPSELSFGPYAQVVDMIRTSAAFLCVDNDNRYIEFDRTKRRMYKRYERTADGKQKPTGKDLSYAEYYKWLDLAAAARGHYLEGKISKGKALKIICRSEAADQLNL